MYKIVHHQMQTQHIQIDGLLHSAGNKSILANDFTQINSDGMVFMH